MGKSPRKKTRRDAQPQARQPARCQKCPNRPLRTQCVHTNAGKKWLEGNPDLAEAPDTPSRPRHCQICPDRPLRSQCSHTQKGRAFLSAQAAQRRVDSIPLLGLTDRAEPHTPSPLRTDRGGVSMTSTASSEPDAATPSSGPDAATPSSGPDAATPAPTTPDNHIDPRLLDISRSQQLGATHVSPERDLEASPTSQSSLVFARASKRKPTQANPFHGHVDGVKRGNVNYSIYRTKALPNVIENSRDASRRFSRLVNKIVEKCEDVSRQTGCWLFLGTQHTSARGGTISYASPRLRSEAQGTAGSLATDFNGAVATLLSARRADAVELQRNFDEAQASKQVAEQLVIEQQRLIDSYRSQYGDLNLPEGHSTS